LRAFVSDQPAMNQCTTLSVEKKNVSAAVAAVELIPTLVALFKPSCRVSDALLFGAPFAFDHRLSLAALRVSS